MINWCRTTCYLSIVFFIAMIVVIITADKTEKKHKFIKSLNNPLKIEYKKRVDERRSLYFQGYAVGLLISGILILLNIYGMNKKMSKLSMLCTAGTITFITTQMYYTLRTKQNLMVTLLDTDEQKQLWQDLYTTMQRRYNLGILLGVISVSFFSFSMC